MRLTGVVVAAVLLVAGAFASRAPARARCRSGYVDAVVAGARKCLHRGEFCSPGAERVYERHGFACVEGHLRARTSPRAVAPTRARCRLRGALPDPRCSPGAVVATATVARICVPGYARSVRDVSARKRRAVFAEYGIDYHRASGYEVDHLVSLELGGSNALANLWPEPASPRPGFHEKDRLENRLHGLVCAGAMTLRRAQQLVATNWVAAYRRYAAS